MKPTLPPPSPQTIDALLRVLSPGSTVEAIQPLIGSFSNSTCLVDIRSASGAQNRIVVRRYAVFGDYDRGEKARREYKTLELLRAHGIPAPQPLYLDSDGTILGTPGIVTSFAPGKQVVAPADPVHWARELAVTLAGIHSIPCEAKEASFLLDANSEAVWFLKSRSVPETMQAHPAGAAVWKAVHVLYPNISRVKPTLVHIDYQPGNILWENGRISAVLDWEEAACGDPGIDVAYLYAELIISNTQSIAQEFLQVYKAETGHGVDNLEFWELAAAARFMPDPAAILPEWQLLGNKSCSESSARQGLAKLITDAMRKVGL